MSDGEKSFQAGYAGGPLPVNADLNRYDQGKTVRQQNDQANQQLHDAGQIPRSDPLAHVRQSPPIHVNLSPRRARFLLCLIVGCVIAASITRDKSMVIPIGAIFAIGFEILLRIVGRLMPRK